MDKKLFCVHCRKRQCGNHSALRRDAENEGLMHVIRFRLRVAAWQKDELDKRFRAAWHIHNETVKYAQKCLNKLRNDRQYLDALAAYAEASKKLKSMPDRKNKSKAAAKHKRELMLQKKEAAAILHEKVLAYGISRLDFYRFVSVMQRKIPHLISSQQAQREADRVLTGVEKVLYGNGKRVHLKKLANQHSVSQKCATNGVTVDLKNKTATWGSHRQNNMLSMKIDINNTDPYVAESISHSLRYAEISREIFRNGYHYYITLVLDGPAPKKLSPSKSGGATGIDPGISTIAAVSGDSVRLQELAPKARSYEKKIAKQQRLIDADLRRDNPGNYESDGTVKSGSHTWVLSKGCRRRKQEVRVLNRKQAAATRNSHNRLANELIAQNGVLFITEEMNWAALAKRAKAKPERRMVPSVIKRKDGSEKTVFKYKKKRRFGASIHSRAPATMMSILARKADQYGGQVACVDTKAFRASQYHHDTGEYIKTTLSDRWKIIDQHKVQRDLYSAFLLLCADVSGKMPDHDMCQALFPEFIDLHDQFIKQTKSTPHPACFGY